MRVAYPAVLHSVQYKGRMAVRSRFVRAIRGSISNAVTRVRSLLSCSSLPLG